MVWFTSPAKEVLNVLFNRILAPYVENLDMSQVNYGIGQGQLTLQSLRLKKGALDKFRLPVDVIEGHLGKFTLSLHWMNLGNEPVEIFVEDVYLLVVPSPANNEDPEEEEARAQAVKQDRVKNAELLHLRSSAEQVAEDPQQPQGLIASLIAKIINNLQVTVKNVHIRYEDKLSVPGHPFAAGITLSGFTARSVNEEWQPAFIESTAGSIHKLGKLESLAVYFNTDAETMEGIPHLDFVKRFADLIARDGHVPEHQFIMKPVTGEGRIKMNNRLDKNTPRFDVQLLFDEIGVVVDDNQYHDAISLLDMFHIYARQHQYRKYRPSEEEFKENRSRALIRFAGRAILGDIHERNRRWTWPYFAERRDDRNAYVDLFKKQSLNQLGAGSPEAQRLEDLERKLTYEDIRFYRSIARSQLRKDLAARRRLEYERARQQQQQEPQQSRGWTSWLWGSGSADSSSSGASDEISALSNPMTDSQRKELYDMLDYDEKAVLAESFSASQDALEARVVAKLQKGSFALKSDPHGAAREILSIVFERFQANVLQRPENLVCAVSLGGFGVFDGTTKETLHPRIVHVKENAATGDAADDPFFFLEFENNPLDQRADMALTMRLRHMEIIYHKGYIEAIYRFFKPPESQLESVEALLSVASETLEGIRRDTRAGLEYALQTHKTVDVQMDLNAPIIIVPEDITTYKCRHLVIDAGHIAIESDLADKSAMHEIQSKRNQQYTEADYKRLESLMYDKFSLKLEAAQFLLGNDLDSCRRALTSQERDTLHLVERINMDFQVQKSIVPEALTLARIKVAGKLPSLQVNFSDTKYKALMRLIDVTIPKFDDDPGPSAQPPPPSDPSVVTRTRPELSGGHVSGGFTLPYWGKNQEYNVDTDESDEDEEGDAQEQFFDPETPNASARPDLHQHTFELAFSVDQLRVLLSKSSNGGQEKALGDISLERFALDFSLAKYDMQADIRLRTLSMQVHQSEDKSIQFMSSPSVEQDRNLLTVKYLRAQRESPEFDTLYEGIDQNVDVEISTFIFRAAPEPVLSLYDFIMTTFTTPDNVSVPSTSDGVVQTNQVVSPRPAADSKMKVLVKLAGVQLVLINNDVQLATASLSTAAVTVLLRPNTMRVTGRLGSMAMHDDSGMEVASSEFKEIMSIEGDNFAEFSYQTFDPKDPENTSGINSRVVFKAASMKVHFVEQALRGVYLFLLKLSNLKFLYDAAAQAAAQRAAEITRMQFEVTIKTPIIIVPTDATSSTDVLTTRLGEIGARNEYKGDETKTYASLHGIQLVSTLAQQTTLRMIDDINIDTEVTQTSNIDRSRERNLPDTQVAVKISDIKLHLTQTQYGVIMSLLQSISRVFAPDPEAVAEAVEKSSVVPSSQKSNITSRSGPSGDEDVLDLRPELPRTVSRPSTWTTIDLVLTMNAIKLHLYGSGATSDVDRREHGIARFAINETEIRFKMLSNGAQEAQLILKSFTMSNTKPGPTKFREIIPAAKHDRNQFMVLYTSSGGSENSALAVVTIDSPEIIFSLDPLFALADFFMSGLPTSSPPPSQSDTQTSSLQSQGTSFDFRVDLHDVSVNVLEDDTRADTRAIALSIKQILLSQQGILALSIQECGMSLLQMGKTSESARFLDDVDFTFSLDNRASSATQQVMSIDMTAKPIVLRASYRDINLILAIVNRALVLSGTQQQQQHANPRPATDSTASNLDSRAVVKSGKVSELASGQARVVMAKEQLTASFEGFRLVLISDIHEQPALNLRVKPFIINAKDWSGELHASSTLAVSLNYWNLTNSHWEPMFDPWTFTMMVAKENANSGPTATFSARERLDLNISTTFVELSLNLLSTLSDQGESLLTRDRGSVAPYRIRNHTGSPVLLWSDDDGSNDVKDLEAVKVEDGQSVDWRFDDWRATREHMSSKRNNIGIQFVGKTWENLRSIPVDREGEFVFSLRPRTEQYVDRILCEVKVQDSVKVVTLRSTYKIDNQTLYPVELVMVDDAGQPVQSVQKIPPGKDYSLPIEAVARNRIRIQPDQGFGYKWSSAIRFEDLIAKKTFNIKCAHSDEKEAAFRFHACVETDLNDPVAKKYPKIKLKLRAPVELENLLPYNLEYRIYDKNTDQNWRSYLRKGGIMPVHSVELGHLVLLNIAIQESAFKPSEFSIINADAHSDFDVEKKLTLRDQRDRKIDVKLNYVRYPDAGGAFKVQIYSPYVLINKTGLPFAIRSRSSRAAQPTDVAGDTRLDVLSTNAPFLLSSNNDRGHEFTFKLGDSGWSKLIGFEAPSAEVALVLPSQSQKNEEIQVGLSWTEGLGKYKLSKVVTLAPRFLVKNNLKEPLCFREHGGAPRGRSMLDPGERQPLQFMRSTQEKLLTFAFPGLNAEWSAPINMEDIGSVHFRLHHPTRPDDLRLLRADVQIDGPSIFIYVYDAENNWPFAIENLSQYHASLSQTANDGTTSSSLPTYSLPPSSSLDYAWDQPAVRGKKIQLTIHGTRRAVDIMEIGDLFPFKFSTNDGNRTVSLDVRADGPRQILRITNYIPELSLYKPRRRNTGSLSRADTLRADSFSSSQEAFEAITEDVSASFTLKLDLHGIGISLINRKMVEVIYVSVNDLKFDYSSSPIAQSVNVAAGSLQVDNQLHDAIFPVVLQPTPIEKETGGVAALPTVQASMVWLADQEHGVFFIKYCSILLQALTIEADEDFLFAVYDLAQIQGASWERAQEDTLIIQPDAIPEPRPEQSGQDLYFEVLELQPIRLSISFMRTERVSGETKLSTRNPLAVVVNALTMTLGNVNDAPLEMNALAIKDMRLTSAELTNRIIYHYRQEVLRQLYRILGSADFFGNPVGLFTNVSSGVADIFYEPFNGVVMHGNRDLGIGIAKGAASFVKKTVFGVTDSMTKFTGSIGKGLSAATMDSDFQLRRRMTQRRNKPRHAIYGVAAGAEAFATSVASGMEGILMKPIEGAESGGATGFFKGVGKGVVGAFTKPAVGFFDLASNVTEGIRNTTTVFDNPARDRVRLPRHIPPDGVLRPYSERDALGQLWMKDIENGQFRNELYVAHINLPQGDGVVILTATRLLSIRSKRLKLEWELPFSSVQTVTIEDTGIRFAHKSGKAQDRFVYIPDKGSQSWFFGQVAAVVKDYNVRKRMD